MISISRRVSYVILFGGFLAWWGNKGVIKLFLLVYATFVSGNNTLIYTSTPRVKDRSVEEVYIYIRTHSD